MMKTTKTTKNYPLKTSPLYKLSNKRKLAELLKCDAKWLARFQSSRDNYAIFSIKQDKKNRIIEDPNPFLKKVHRNIQQLISRIEPPEYLISGRKGFNYTNNAEKHKDNNFFLCMDIKSFYQSARKTFLSATLENLFLIPNDIALRIADLLTIPSECQSYSYIPTGSPASQIAIFWAYYQTFNDIETEASKRDITFTLYVDDLTFSSKRIIPKNFGRYIISRFNKVRLSIKAEKTKYYNPDEYKIVTGCVITPDHEVRIQNRKRNNIIQTLESKPNLNEFTYKELQRLLGRIVSQKQIEPSFMDKTYDTVLARMRKIRSIMNGCSA